MGTLRSNVMCVKEVKAFQIRGWALGVVCLSVVRIAHQCQLYANEILTFKTYCSLVIL